MNIIKCPKCNYSLIDEEVSNHICKEILDYKIEDDIAYFFDGEKWYPVVKFTHQPIGNNNKNNPRGNSFRKRSIY